MIVEPGLTFGVTAILFLVNIIAQLVFKRKLENHWSVKISDFEEREKRGLK